MLTGVAHMQHDVRLEYQQALDESHDGHPVVVQTVHGGGRGRPHIYIDPEFLAWAYTQRSVSSIARFVGVSRRTVVNILADYGITQTSASGANPFSAEASTSSGDSEDAILDPLLAEYSNLSTSSLEDAAISLEHPTTAAVSTLTDDELDTVLIGLRQHFRRAGLTMLLGMLRSLGHRVPRERIRASLLRIDPVHRVFDRIRIRRREYSVPGPNSLWHHDGQHGMSYYFV